MAFFADHSAHRMESLANLRIGIRLQAATRHSSATRFTSGCARSSEATWHSGRMPRSEVSKSPPLIRVGFRHSRGLQAKDDTWRPHGTTWSEASLATDCADPVGTAVHGVPGRQLGPGPITLLAQWRVRQVGAFFLIGTLAGTEAQLGIRFDEVLKFERSKTWTLASSPPFWTRACS